LEFLFAAGESAPSAGIAGFIPILAIVAIFYLLIWRPQSKQRKAHVEQLKALRKGDSVLTRGGIYGKIAGFQGKENQKVIVDVGGNIKLTVARTYIAGLADSAPENPEGN